MIHLTILHCNDIYELTPVSGGALGGLARVATLRQQLLARNPNTRVMFAGDLYGPSGLDAVRVDGQSLAGQPAVAVMNCVGVDYMTFGDHELNTISLAHFAACLAATQCKVISSNIFASTGKPFSFGATTVLAHDIFVVTNEQGARMRVGVFGLTKPVRLPQFEFTYLDWLEAAATQVTALRQQVDLLIALTHQPLANDQQLVAQFPQIDLVLGGDDHQHMKSVVSPELAPIYKADSNARTVYVLDLFYDPATKELNIQDQLQPITTAIPADPATLAETNHWMDLAFATLRAAGDEPTRVLGYAPVVLDGFETTIRRQRTAFTDLITAGMQQQATNSEIAIICSWAVRLDDCLPAGAPVTRYDLMRTFPYGSSPLYAVATPGSLLAEILNFGGQHIGSGSYLLTSPNVTEQAGQWQINQAPLDATRTYVVAMADDLLKDYLFLINAARAAEVTVLGVYGDISQAVINQLQRVTPQHTVAELSQKAGQER